MREVGRQHSSIWKRSGTRVSLSGSLPPFALSLCVRLSPASLHLFSFKEGILKSDLKLVFPSATQHINTHTHTHFNINNCHMQSQPHENHITSHLESKQSDTSKTNSGIKPSLTHCKWTVSNAGDPFIPNQHKSGFSTMIRSSHPATAFTELHCIYLLILKCICIWPFWGFHKHWGKLSTQRHAVVFPWIRNLSQRTGASTVASIK